jgi:hypothetical protein
MTLLELLLERLKYMIESVNFLKDIGEFRIIFL